MIIRNLKDYGKVFTSVDRGVDERLYVAFDIYNDYAIKILPKFTSTHAYRTLGYVEITREASVKDWAITGWKEYEDLVMEYLVDNCIVKYDKYFTPRLEKLGRA